MPAIVAVAAIVFLAAGAARAQQGPNPRPAAPRSAPPAQRVALAPLTSLTEGAGKLAPLEAIVGEGLAALSGVTVISAQEVRQAIKKARRPELEACAGETTCLAELGKVASADRVVAGEVGGLGDDQIVYLKVVDVAGAREAGSTTAVLEKGVESRRKEARAAAFRLLAPQRYAGTLQLRVDVPGAIVYLDGKKIATSPVPTLPVAVGTHALRVTHEQYRDFVRFVDVEFGETTELPVAMTAFPVISDEMRGQRERKPSGPVAPLPWYRRWYTVVGFGAAILLTSAVVTYVAADPVDSDAQITLDRR
jgi:hypothetical protein